MEPEGLIPDFSYTRFARMVLESAQELSLMFTLQDQGMEQIFLSLAPAELIASHNFCVVFWPYMAAAVDHVLDASLGNFPQKHTRICPTRLRRLFFWMDLYLCMRKLGTGEAVAYFSFLFGFISCFRNRTD